MECVGGQKVSKHFLRHKNRQKSYIQTEWENGALKLWAWLGLDSELAVSLHKNEFCNLAFDVWTNSSLVLSRQLKVVKRMRGLNLFTYKMRIQFHSSSDAPLNRINRLVYHIFPETELASIIKYTFLFEVTHLTLKWVDSTDRASLKCGCNS